MTTLRSSGRTRHAALGLVTATVLTALGVGAPAQAVAEEQNRLVPAYFYPHATASLWPLTCSATSPSGASSIVIMNPDSGPGTAANPLYTNAVADCHAKGQKVVGYISSAYGRRSLDVVKAEIDRYFALYRVDGVFIDEMHNFPVDHHSGQDTRAYYKALYDHVKTRTAAEELVVGNPGNAAYTDWQLTTPVADKLVIFEGTAHSYETWRPPAWVLEGDPQDFGHVVNATAADRRQRVCEQSRERNAGFIHVTDDVVPNPWDTLPSYWDAKVPTCYQMTPRAPIFVEKDGTAADTYTLQATEGAEYLVDGVVTAPGTYSGAGTVTVTVRTTGVYAFSAMATQVWQKTFGTGPADYTPPTVSPFKDVATTQQFYKEMAWTAESEISTGWTDVSGNRSYRALQPINRDAMAAFLYRMADSPDYTPPADSPFKDVATTQQFYKEMAWLADRGISTGWTHSDGTRSYRALQPINRDAMAAFLYRMELAGVRAR